MLRPAFIALLLLLSAASLGAQVTGERPDSSRDTARIVIPTDTHFVFTPARPLIDPTRGVSIDEREHFGVGVLFSSSGLGFGAHYVWPLGGAFTATVEAGITGTRERDEFERWDPVLQDNRVPGKVNRVFTLPVTVGIRYRVLAGSLDHTLRPYVSLGAGPSVAFNLPYEYSFFESFGHTGIHFTGGGYIGLGAEFGDGSPAIGLNARYFFIPISPGIESIAGEPMRDLGGLFLTLNIGL